MNHELDGGVRSVRLGATTRKEKIAVSKGIKEHLSGLADDAEIVYVVRDQRSGEVLSVGKSSKGPDSVNMTTRTQKYMRQEEFLRANGHADVELVIDYAVVKPSSVKALQQRGLQVESGIEAPLRATHAKDSGLLWDNSGNRLGIDGPKWVSDNPQLLQNWLNQRQGWLWRGSGI